MTGRPGSGGEVDLVVVPYEVERADTPAAEAPLRILDLGLEEGLREAGLSTQRRVLSIPAGERSQTVGRIARGVAAAVTEARIAERPAVVLSGGCLAAVGVVAGLGRIEQAPGVVWVDAHGDFNTPASSPSGYWDGMALAAACGRGLEEVFGELGLDPLDPARVIHLGGRDLDPPEREAFAELGVALLPPGPELVDRFRSLVPRLAEPPFYLHCDLDGLDPAVAPAVSRPVAGGVEVEQLAAIAALLPAPAVVTLSALSFADADPAAAGTTATTCLRLLLSVLPAPEADA